MQLLNKTYSYLISSLISRGVYSTYASTAKDLARNNKALCLAYKLYPYLDTQYGGINDLKKACEFSVLKPE